MTRTQGFGLPDGHYVVAGALDDNMVYPAIVWAYSLSKTASRPIHFIVGYLSGSLSNENKESLEKVLSAIGVSSHFIELGHDPLFIAQGHISPTTFTKFLLADLIEQMNVWVDIDITATNGWDDIFDLIDLSPKESLLTVAERHHGTGGRSEQSLSDGRMIFNAGVLGWPNRKRLPWREALRNTEVLTTQEQFLFNSLYSGFLHLVSERFNALSYHYATVEPRKSPYLIHFAGAHKPWHLPRRFSKLCTKHQCPWSLWFSAEDSMLRDAIPKAIIEDVESLQKTALHSGTTPRGRAHRGRRFLRLLVLIGPLGWLLVFLMAPFRQLIPQGTHPLH